MEDIDPGSSGNPDSAEDAQTAEDQELVYWKQRALAAETPVAGEDASHPGEGVEMTQGQMLYRLRVDPVFRVKVTEVFRESEQVAMHCRMAMHEGLLADGNRRIARLSHQARGALSTIRILRARGVL